MPQPIAEVFGVPISDASKATQDHITAKLCPFNNVRPHCTKDKLADPLGVCSVLEGGTAHITCPVRFREHWKICEDAASFFFGRGVPYERLSEVRLKDAEGKSAGNVDYVLVKLDSGGSIADFGALEVQAVYVQGNIRNAYAHYMATRDPAMDWAGQPFYPSPDYYSSEKRLAHQIYSKGSIFKGWAKRQAIAIQDSFYTTLPQLDEVGPDEADLAWFLYQLRYDPARMRYRLELARTVYTAFAEALERISVPAAGDIRPFMNILERKLKDKRRGGRAEDTESPVATSD